MKILFTLQCVNIVKLFEFLLLGGDITGGGQAEDKDSIKSTRSKHNSHCKNL